MIDTDSDIQGCDSAWFPIDTAPKDGTEILVKGGIYGCDEIWLEISSAPFKEIRIAYWDEHCWYDAVNCNFWYRPTHWMPLPSID